MKRRGSERGWMNSPIRNFSVDARRERAQIPIQHHRTRASLSAFVTIQVARWPIPKASGHTSALFLISDRRAPRLDSCRGWNCSTRIAQNSASIFCATTTQSVSLVSRPSVALHAHQCAARFCPPQQHFEYDGSRECTQLQFQHFRVRTFSSPNRARWAIRNLNARSPKHNCTPIFSWTSTRHFFRSIAY